MKTFIENGTVIAWVGDRHQAIENGTVVFEDDVILEVASEPTSKPAPQDVRIDARGRIVSPGFVNAHLHVTDTLYTKGYLEEASNLASEAKETNFGTLYKMLPAVSYWSWAADSSARVPVPTSASRSLRAKGLWRATHCPASGCDS